MFKNGNHKRSQQESHYANITLIFSRRRGGEQQKNLNQAKSLRFEAAAERHLMRAIREEPHGLLQPYHRSALKCQKQECDRPKQWLRRRGKQTKMQRTAEVSNTAPMAGCKLNSDCPHAPRKCYANCKAHTCRFPSLRWCLLRTGDTRHFQMVRTCQQNIDCIQLRPKFASCCLQGTGCKNDSHAKKISWMTTFTLSTGSGKSPSIASLTCQACLYAWVLQVLSRQKHF